MKKMRSMKGFTLIELMIVIAIIGVIAAIAYPSYRKNILETHRKAAMTELLAAQQMLERLYTQSNGAYPISAAKAGSCSAGGGFSYPATGEPKYSLDITFPNTAKTFSQTYTVTATPCGGQADDRCGTFSIDQNDLITVANGEKKCF